MNLYISKLYVFLLLILFRLIFGFCPLLISRKIKRRYGLENINKLWIENGVLYSMDFSGGVLLATCFIHMIPEVRHHLLEILKEKYQFPFAETLVCAGFFLVYVIEESVKHVFNTRSSKNLIKKSDTLIFSKLNETLPSAEENTKNSDGCEKETITISVDISGESANNGIVSPTATANNGLMSEVREDINENNNAMNAKNLRNLLLITALSFHSVMEGLAIGLAQNTEDVWYLFLAVTLHECILLLCIGIEIVANCPSVSTIITYMIVFALISPAGVLFGTIITFNISETESSFLQLLFIGSLQGLAAGTILYVTFFEVLTGHKHHHQEYHYHNHHHYHRTKSNQSRSSVLKLLFICMGFMFMVVLEILGSHASMHHLSEHVLNNNKSSF